MKIQEISALTSKTQNYQREFDRLYKALQEGSSDPKKDIYDLSDILLERVDKIEGKAKIISRENSLKEILTDPAEYYQIDDKFYKPSTFFLQEKLIDEDGKIIISPIFKIKEDRSEWLNNFLLKNQYSLCPSLNFNATQQKLSQSIEHLVEASSEGSVLTVDQFRKMYEQLRSMDHASLRELISPSEYCPKPIIIDGRVLKENPGEFLSAFSNLFIPPRFLTNQLSGEVAINMAMIIAGQIGDFQSGREKYLLAMQNGCLAEAPASSMDYICESKLAEAMLLLGAIELSSIFARTIAKGIAHYNKSNDKIAEFVGDLSETMTRIAGYALVTSKNKIGIDNFLGASLSTLLITGRMLANNMPETLNPFCEIAKVSTYNFKNNTSFQKATNQTLFMFGTLLLGSIFSEALEKKDNKLFVGSDIILLSCSTGITSGILMAGSEKLINKFSTMLADRSIQEMERRFDVDAATELAISISRVENLPESPTPQTAGRESPTPQTAGGGVEGMSVSAELVFALSNSSSAGVRDSGCLVSQIPENTEKAR